MRIVLTLLLWMSLSVSASEFHRTKALAEQGHADAQINLGLMYAKGQGGVTQDFKEAIRWYKAAAEQGYAEAQFNLGIMYGLGNRRQYYKLIHMWYNLAAANGLEDAVKNRDMVARQMTATDIAVAQQMAKKWLAAHPAAQ